MANVHVVEMCMLRCICGVEEYRVGSGNMRGNSSIALIEEKIKKCSGCKWTIRNSLAECIEGL